MAFCLFGGDIPAGGMEPRTRVVSCDAGEPIVPGGSAGFAASLVHEFSFKVPRQFPSRHCPNTLTVPAIALPAHGLTDPRRAGNH